MDSNGNGTHDHRRPPEIEGAPGSVGVPSEPGTIRLRGDELDRYAEFHTELFVTIRGSVRASLETIDDACGFAWLQFLRCQPDRDANWKGWMVTTAQREAWRLNALEWRERESLSGSGKPHVRVDPEDRYDRFVLFDAAIEELRELQRVVLVNSQVWKQEEVAEILGVSVDRAVSMIRAAADQVATRNEHRHDRERPVASPRAARLRELEDHPPEWLSKVIGRCPNRSKSSAGVMLTWRRAALAIEDYRRGSGYENPSEAIGFVPRDHEQKRAYIRAERGILRVASERERRHGIER